MEQLYRDFFNIHWRKYFLKDSGSRSERPDGNQVCPIHAEVQTCTEHLNNT